MPVGALKYGLIGLGFLLALLAFLLLQNEQRRDPPRNIMFRQIYLFMAFALCVMVIGIFAQLKTITFNPKAGTDVDAAYEGDWSFDGSDIDYEPTHFKALYTYRGKLRFLREGSILKFSGSVETLKDSQSLGSAELHGEGPVRDNQLAAQYDYDTGNRSIRGFGTIFIQFNHTMKNVPAYLLYRVTTSDGTVAAGTATLSRL